ncbi:MAG: oligopeptide/dipeptide ABC transporter ATP-binding protein [Thermoplasmataceae archaeon]|jgi:peptide/nickel transport system ATP-binding protein
MMSGSPVSPESPLVVDGLKSYFITLDGVAKVLTKLSFNLNKSEILGVFGESRSGKTVAARSIVDLLRSPGYVVGGGVYIDGFNIFRDVKRLDKLGAAISSGKEKKSGVHGLNRQEELMRLIRGKTITLVSEDAYSSLNPMQTIGDQFLEAILSQNASEICQSIIQREEFSLEDVEKLVSTVEQQPDLPGRKRIIRQWMTDHALFATRDMIMNAFDFKYGQEDLAQEVFFIASTEKVKTDIEEARTVKSAFDFHSRISKLTVELARAMADKDTELAKDLQTDLNNTEGRLKSLGSFEKIQKSVLSGSKHAFIREIALKYARNLLRDFGVVDTDSLLASYPHDLGNVLKQKIALALAFSIKPKIMILDEPTGSFDVNTKLKILSSIKEEHRSRNDLSILIFSKDLTVLSAISDRVLVMYSGNVIEESTMNVLIHDSKHPFTSGVINTFEAAERVSDKTVKLEYTPGFAPDFVNPPKGCRFNPRCKFRMDMCSIRKPLLSSISEGHKVACFLYSEAVEEER